MGAEGWITVYDEGWIIFRTIGCIDFRLIFRFTSYTVNWTKSIGFQIRFVHVMVAAEPWVDAHTRLQRCDISSLFKQVT